MQYVQFLLSNGAGFFVPRVNIATSRWKLFFASDKTDLHLSSEGS
jgi:hypothetical protein